MWNARGCSIIKQNVIHIDKTGNENEIFSKIMVPICGA
jgi:hypothetical protein